MLRQSVSSAVGPEEGTGMGWEGTGAVGTAASETGERGGEEFAVTAMQPEGPPGMGTQ